MAGFNVVVLHLWAPASELVTYKSVSNEQQTEALCSV
jgi:hypothetical protein